MLVILLELDTKYFISTYERCKRGFPGGTMVRNPLANAGGPGSIPAL